MEPARVIGRASWTQPASFLAIFLGLSALYLYRMSPAVIDPDLWHEMALAREVIESGHIPQGDRFAYTPTVYPVVHHEWGAGMIAYGIGNAFGASGMVALRYLLGGALAYLVIRTARRRGAGLAEMLFSLPVGILLVDSGFATVRAQLYSMVFVAVLADVLDRDRLGSRRWMAPWLGCWLIWVNVHGGLLVGLGLLGAELAGRMVRGQPWRHLLAVMVGMALLIAVNPFGVAYYRYLWEAWRLARPHVAEWGPLWLDPMDLAIYLIALAIAGYAAGSIGWRRAAGTEMLAAAALLSLVHQRLVMFFGLLYCAYVPGWLAQTPLGEQLRHVVARRRALVAMVWLVVTLFVGFQMWARPHWPARVPGQRSIEKGAPYYPVGAVHYLATCGFTGNVMTPFDWGSYVMWKLGPAVKVSLDGRYEVAYPPAIEKESYSFYFAEPGWRETLKKYPTDLVLAPRDLPIVTALASTDWQKAYSDGGFVLFARPGLLLPRVDRGSRVDEGTFP